MIERVSEERPSGVGTKNICWGLLLCVILVVAPGLGGCSIGGPAATRRLRDVRIDGDHLYLIEAAAKWSTIKSFYSHDAGGELLSYEVSYVSYELTRDASPNVSAKEKLRVQIASDLKAFDTDFLIAGPLPGVIRVNPKDAGLYDVAKRAWSPFSVQVLAPSSVGSRVVASSLDGSVLFTGTLVLTLPPDADPSYAAFCQKLLADPNFRPKAIQGRSFITRDAREVVYQDEEDGKQIHVASRDGREAVVTAPVAATLRGAERIGEDLVLLFSTRAEAIVWKVASGQTLRHETAKGAVSAWDPFHDEVLCLDDPEMEKPSSGFTLWNYREQRARTGELVW